MDVMQELLLIDKLYNSQKYSEGLYKLNELWTSIPEPRVEVLNAYLIIEFAVSFSLKLGKLDEAWKWAKYAFDFRSKRHDLGEAEFLVGKVAFERGDIETAKQNFMVANKKSRGRIFIEEDPKYKI